jgi:hypothetical protein
MVSLSRCLASATVFVALANSGCDSPPPPAAPAATTENTVEPAKRESQKQNWKQLQPRGFTKKG